MPARRKPTILLLAAAALIVAVLATLWPFVPTLRFLATLTGGIGPVGRLLSVDAQPVATRDLEVPTRHGPAPARVYSTTPVSPSTVLVIPGVHGGGLDEPRQTRFAVRLASTGVTVVVVPLPDLREFRLTPRSTEQIEDAVRWVTSTPPLAPAGRIGLVGVSFGGGLAVVAAGRPSVADRIDFVLSLGGHGDFARALRYLCTGVLPDGTVRPPHDYGVALAALGGVPWIVPADQAAPLEDGLRMYLNAAFDTSEAQTDARRLLAGARQAADRLPDPAGAILAAAVERDVRTLGRLVAPAIEPLSADPALSPERSPVPRVPVFLLHGAADNVIPSTETELLAAHLEQHGVSVHALLTPALSHVGIQPEIGLADYWRLVTFWKAVREAMDRGN